MTVSLIEDTTSYIPNFLVWDLIFLHGFFSPPV